MTKRKTAQAKLASTSPAREKKRGWTFLTNYAQVLLVIAGDSRVTAKEIARQVGITERAVQRILTDLVSAGYISRVREGRQNLYEIHSHMPMRHPAQRGHTVRELLTFFEG